MTPEPQATGAMPSFEARRRDVLRAGLAMPLFAGLLSACDGDVVVDQARSLGAKAATAGSMGLPDADFHLLRRSSFGVHAPTLKHLRDVGASTFLERQLDPSSIDDSAVEAAVLSRFPLAVSAPSALATGFPANSASIVSQLRDATLFRACYSKRQLYEVMVEFWSDHFNIQINKGVIPAFKPYDDYAVIRANALGNFRTLLKASARSPAMLYYLDNYVNLNTAPQENYARELMELHTLGIDGGYSEADVKEVARCLTGWTVDRSVSAFKFGPAVHDYGSKTVLGTAIAAGGGISDGETVLDLLAGHPATARHIATKLCRRFVADSPPAAVVDSVAQAFLGSGGDIRSCLRVLFASSEFAQAGDAKYARPTQFVGQLVRSLNPSLSMPPPGDTFLQSLVSLLGQLPFNWLEPDGYPDRASYWATTNGLIARWRIATYAATSGQFDLSDLAAATTPARLVEAAADKVLQRPLSTYDRDLLLDWLYLQSNLTPDQYFEFTRAPWLVALIASLLISSSSFQYR